MVNRVLLYSSLICGGIHLVYPSHLVVHRMAMMSGVMTSIWNHGTTSPIAKWTDRGMMMVAVIVHVRMYHHYLATLYCIVAYRCVIPIVFYSFLLFPTE